MVITFRPTHLKTLASFTEFSLEEYVMMPNHQPAIDSPQFAHRIACRPLNGGPVEFLPEALVELWRQGRVPPEQIPSLTRAIAPKLGKDDFNLILHQDAKKAIWIPLGIVAIVSLGTSFFITVDGQRAPRPVAVLSGLGITLLTGIIFWIARQSQRRRRKEQMNWLIALSQGKQPDAGIEGKTKNYVRLYFQLFGLMLAVMLLIGCGVYVYETYFGGWQGGPAMAQEGSNDLQMSVEVTAAEAASGKTIVIGHPKTLEKLTVKIPTAVQTGTRLRLRGQGVTPAGDLYITIRVR